jgi:hypothetical protein
MSLVVSPTAPLLVLRERVRQQNATVGTDIRNLSLLSDADTIVQRTGSAYSRIKTQGGIGYSAYSVLNYGSMV